MSMRSIGSQVNSLLSRVWAVPTLGIVALLVGLPGFIKIAPALFSIPEQMDFAAFYAAGYRILHGDQNLYAGMTAGVAQTPATWPPLVVLYESGNRYPPFFSVIMAPFAIGAYDLAHVQWFVFNVLAVAVSIWLIFRIIEYRPTGWELAAIIFAILIFPPFYGTLILGQTQCLLLLLLVATYYLIVRGHPLVAGVLLGLAVVIKLNPLLVVLYFAWKRQWKVVIGVVATLVITSLIGVILAGWETNRYFLTAVLPTALAQRTDFPPNQAISGVLARLLLDGEYGLRLWPDFAAHRLLTLLTSLVFIVSAGHLCTRRQPTSSQQRLLEYCLVLVTMNLVNNIGWDLYALFLALPYLALWFSQQLSRQLQPTLRASVLVSYLLLQLERYWRVLPQVSLVMDLGFLGTVIIWLALAFCLIQVSSGLVGNKGDNVTGRLQRT